MGNTEYKDPCERCHTYEITKQRIVRVNENEKHMYVMMTCRDCGDERYERDGSVIRPSEYYQAVKN